jgi:UDP:flavonoid glycosyltransferase YjiC (YdhE family)
MKIAFLGVRVPGHLNPTTTLGRQLQARNHEIIFPYSSGAGGLPFISGFEKDHVNRWR